MWLVPITCFTMASLREALVGCILLNVQVNVSKQHIFLTDTQNQKVSLMLLLTSNMCHCVFPIFFTFDRIGLNVT